MAYIGVAHTSAFTGQPEEAFYRVFHSQKLAAADLADGAHVCFVLPGPADIVKITVRADAIGAASADQITWKVAPSGTDLNAGAGGTAITAALETNGLTADTAADIPLDQTNSPHKNLATGTQVFMLTAGTIASLAGFCYTIVYRMGPYRRADGSAAGDRLGNILQGS